MSKNFRYVAKTIAKVDAKLGLVFGYAIVCKINGKDYYDLQGDHIPEEAMLDASIEYMAGSRVAKEMHEGADAGQVVFAFPLTADLAKALNIAAPQTGLLVGMKPTPEVFTKFVSGEYRGFSIGGVALEVQEESMDGQKTN